MLTITTETRRFVLKENEEQSEKKFNEIIRKLLELPEEIIDDKKPQETENTNRQQEEKPSGHEYNQGTGCKNRKQCSASYGGSIGESKLPISENW